MGATSVTGKGLGSADGMNKGSSRDTLGVGHLIGPRVVYAGNWTLVGATDTIEYPTLSGVVGDYSFHVTATTTGHVFVSNPTTNSFVLNGTDGQVVSWMIVKNGY